MENIERKLSIQAFERYIPTQAVRKQFLQERGPDYSSIRITLATLEPEEGILLAERLLFGLSHEDDFWDQDHRDVALTMLGGTNLTGVDERRIVKIYSDSLNSIPETADPLGSIDHMLSAGPILARFIHDSNLQSLIQNTFIRIGAEFGLPAEERSARLDELLASFPFPEGKSALDDEEIEEFDEPEDITLESLDEAIQSISEYYNLGLDAFRADHISITNPPECSASISKEAEFGYYKLKNAIRETESIWGKAFLSSPSVVAFFSRVTDILELAPEEAQVLATAAIKLGLDSLDSEVVFFLPLNEEDEPDEDIEEINLSEYSNFSVIWTEKFKSQSSSTGMYFVNKRDLKDISIDLPEMRHDERLKKYFGSFLDSKIFSPDQIRTLLELDNTTQMFNELLEIRQSLVTPDSVSQLVDEIGYNF